MTDTTDLSTNHPPSSRIPTSTKGTSRRVEPPKSSLVHTTTSTIDRQPEILQLWDDHGQLGMVLYGLRSDHSYGYDWSSRDVGQGSGAIAWLEADVAGDGRTSIVQLWNNGGQLGMIVYSQLPDGSYATTWSRSDMGSGAPAVGWVTADVYGDGKTSIVQLWNNDGQLGMIVYSPQPDGSYALTWSNPNMGQGAGAVAFKAIEINGKTSIVQLWNNGGQLGMILYSPQSDGGYKTTWAQEDMSEGSGAIAFETVRFEGTTSILQLWDNCGQLGMIVYSPQSNGSFAVAWQCTNVGQGSGAVAWLTADVSGQGNTSLVQLWNNGGQLGMIVYAPQPHGAFATSWSSADMGQGAGAVGWLTAQIGGKTSIVQLWDNGGQLGMIRYAPSAGGYATAWSNSNLGQGSGALRWFTIEKAVPPRRAALSTARSVLALGAPAEEELAIDLHKIVVAFKDYLFLFNTAKDALYAFVDWYNGNPEAQKVSAPRPRELAHRCVSDLNQARTANGFVVAIENQTLDDLTLDGSIEWYGKPALAAVPKTIEQWSTACLDTTYYRGWNAAATGYRYKVGTSGWYLYVAFFTYRFGSTNASYVRLSRQADISWDEIYYALTNPKSEDTSSDGIYAVKSEIATGLKSVGVVQLHLKKFDGIVTSIKYWLNTWTTPQDYYDEL